MIPAGLCALYAAGWRPLGCEFAERWSRTPRRAITMLVADNVIDRRVLLSARSLDRAGWRVRVIALPHPGLWDDDQRMFPEIDIFRIVPSQHPAITDNRTIETRTSLASRGSEWHRVYPYYFHFLELAVRHPAQIFVAHDLPVLASAVVAARSSGARVAYDAHELYPEQHHFKPEYVEVLSRAEAELIGYADLVTTVNQSIAQEMPKRYRIEQPAVILNAPAAPPKTLPLQRTRLISDRLGLAASQRILLFQGRLSPNRNLEMLVRAMALVRRPETVLVFLGPDGGKRDELQEIARELGLLGARIHFLDPVSQVELLSWTAGADVGIIPYPPIDLNSRLCTPNKLFEFIVAEVPILANDLPELRRFVVENGFGIVRSMHNPPAIAAAIDEMMSIDPSAWWAALRARSAEFVWDRQGEEVVRLYRRFIAVTPARLSAVVLPEPRTICILALSPIADDPRVRRQAEAFHRAGWKVVAVGLPGAKSPPPKWPILTHNSLAAAQTPSFALRLLRRRLRGLQYRLRRAAVSVRPTLAHKNYWSSQNIRDMYQCAQEANAAVWLANDWAMLPIAARLAREKGGIYGYDTHEFATEEYAESRKWRLLHRPMVRAIEREYIRDAAVVSAVSSGIAQRLDALYRLPRPTLAIRNTPDYQQMSFRPTRRDRIEVLYHGIVVPNRGLEAAVESVKQWRPEFTLTIRGPENPAFSPALRERIAALGLQDRVRLAPPVPMTDLVREAATSDVGFFALPGHSRHNEFALPNKFFEYVMAGLALCTTDLPEMARLIREYELGVTIAAVEPAAIAAAINALDLDRIDSFKRNALTAARELCWERELGRLIEAYDAAPSTTRANAA